MSKNEMNNINNGSGSIIDKSSGNVNKITDKSKKITKQFDLSVDDPVLTID